MKTAVRFFTRLLCAVLIFFCVQKTAAGIFFEAGRAAYQEKRYEEAVSLFNRSLGWDSRDPGTLYLSGQSGWKLAHQQGHETMLEKAEESFERLAGILPFYGRAWLYLGLVKLEKQKQSGKITPEFWKKEIGPKLQKASRYEPGSAWVSYKIAAISLKEAPSFSSENQERLLVHFRQAAHVNPKSYLKPSLGLVWDRFRDFRLLETLVPDNFPAYRIWLDSIAEKNLWAHAEPVFRRYLELQQREYGDLCARAEAALAAGDFKAATRDFQRAYGIQNKRARARKGLLEAYEAAGIEIPERMRSWKDEIKPENQKKETDASGIPPPAKTQWDKKGNPLIGPKEKTGTLLRVPKGRKEIAITLRGFPDAFGVYGFVIVRAGGEIIGFTYADTTAWRKESFFLETSGGPVWLEVELVNLTPPPGSRKPVIQLGDVVVQNA